MGPTKCRFGDRLASTSLMQRGRLPKVLLAILAKVVAEVAGWVCVHSTSLLSVPASLCDGTLDGERIKSKY